MTARREWDDARLNAAFRARFDSPPPAILVETMHAQLRAAGPAGSRRSWSWSSPSMRLAVAPLVVVAVALVLVVGSLIGSPGPTPPPTAPSSTQSAVAATPGPTDPSESFAPSGPPPPTTIKVPGMDGEQPVLTVTQALQRPVNEPPNREIVVGGWYSFIPVPCPKVPDETSGLESCAVGFTWLMEEPQSVSAGARPSGAAFNMVTAFTNWQPPTGTSPVAVVVIGHFDDRRADECPAGERQTRCKALFVVDAPLWTGAVGPIEIGNGPDTAAGLPVIDIAAAIEIRDSGSWREIAVAGWYNDPSYFSCPFHGDAGATWLQGYCEDGFRWLMAEPELLTTLDGNGTQLRGPTGKAIQTAFSTVRPVSGNGWPEAGSPVPIPAVFVGHFNDHHAADCYGPNTTPTGEMLKGCRDRFVVDQVAWLNGTALEPASSDWRDPETPPTPSDAEVRGILARHFANAAVLDTTLMSGADLLRIAPAFVDYPLLVAADSVRVVTLLDPGMPGTPCPTRVCDMDEIRPHAFILVIGPAGDLYFDFGTRAVNFLPDVIVVPAAGESPVPVGS